MFNNIKMGTKLIGSFLIIVAILIAVAMVGYVNIKSIANRGDAMYKQNTAAIEEMGSINTSLEKMRADLYRYIEVPEERSATAQSINEQVGSINDTMQTYKSRDIGAEEKKIIADFDTAWPEMVRGMRDADE